MRNRGLWISLAVVVILLFYWTAKNNQFVAQDQAVKSKWADIETQLQRRADLVPNLVATVKGSAKLDQEVYTHLADARAKLAGAPAFSPERVQAANQFESALNRLLVVVENYPQLASQQGFRQLQDQLEGTENRINVARKYYNDAVADYNTSISQAPGNLIASLSGRKQAAYFQAAQGSQEAPKVNF